MLRLTPNYRGVQVKSGIVSECWFSLTDLKYGAGHRLANSECAGLSDSDHVPSLLLPWHPD